MKRSLQRHLSLVLASVILLAGLVAAIASFSLAYSEAKEFQDDMLRQIAILAIDSEESNSVTATQQNQGSDGIIDPESHVTILHLPRDKSPDWPAGDLLPGMHTLDTGSGRFRVFVRKGEIGNRIVVYQPTDARDEIALDSALRTLIPLLLLLPVLVWLIVRIVRSELAPIAQLSMSLDKQSADRPQPLSDADLPQEITPFVDAINRLLERINHLMGQQRRFIADAAHELRSPLTALSVQAQNLRQAGSLEAVQERLIPLQAGIERARQLTEQMLNLARTQAENNLETVVNVSVMARELIAEYLPMAEARNIDLGLEEVVPLVLQASPEVLGLILKNALENALKYTPDGGEVTLRLLSENDSAVIEVVDSGPGIPASEREFVFDSFYRIPGTVGEGSGLGLAIAREAAIRLGGNVSLHEREARHGLVFRYRHVSGR
jgi:two-component system, OmpR family, sensor kinase